MGSLEKLHDAHDDYNRDPFMGVDGDVRRTGNIEYVGGHASVSARAASRSQRVRFAREFTNRLNLNE